MKAESIPRPLLVLLAVAAGASVANVYYAQPLLDQLAQAFALDRAVAGAVLAATQAGSVLALLGLLPLADRGDRRRLLRLQLMALVVALAWLAAARTAVWLLSGMLLAGLLSDASGRRPLMIAALLASATLSLCTALVDDWTTLLVLRTLLGLALSGVPAVAMTYLVEEMDRRALGLAMGLYIGGNAIGGMSGRLLAGIIADHWGWRWGIGVVSIIAIASTVLLWLPLPPSRHFQARRGGLRQLPSRWRALFADPGLPWLFAT
ncbi:hypothetical protein G6F50_012417 [Rhizopus delemar]|uniref:Major facilitator superfamily (MFS) profile domain-containing protein n=1 Tax=Rhizopus delemar TaxID=936053 RepID=A0A9P7CHQ7_9FUNG|nr:hypothetical protein G6F50_012417 [Rhizopus delemar]